VGELRPYQQRGVDWLVFCREAGLGCVLADDMPASRWPAKDNDDADE
jgi:hypothetical protein